MFVSCECHVLSGRGLCDGPITRPEESYRLWCVSECDREAPIIRKPWPTMGFYATKGEGGSIKPNKRTYGQHIYADFHYSCVGITSYANYTACNKGTYSIMDRTRCQTLFYFKVVYSVHCYDELQSIYCTN
jgi:hypothetical protein